MLSNLERFGSIIDCGVVRGLAGVYSDRGYVVLATDSSPSNTDLLTHAIDWTYLPLALNTSEAIATTSVEVYATWNSMAPYCRYCHASDHALLDCLKKKAKVSCYNCNELGHIAKSCPRRHSDPAAGRTAHKARKTPSKVSPSSRLSSTPPPPPASPASTTPSDQSAVVAASSASDMDAPAELPSTALIPGKTISKYAKFEPIITRSKSDVPSLPATSQSPVPSGADKTCSSCHLEGHKTYRSQHCLNHAEYQERRRLAELLASTGELRKS